MLHIEMNTWTKSTRATRQAQDCDHRNAEEDQSAKVQQVIQCQRALTKRARGLDGVLQLLRKAGRSQANVHEVRDDRD